MSIEYLREEFTPLEIVKVPIDYTNIFISILSKNIDRIGLLQSTLSTILLEVKNARIMVQLNYSQDLPPTFFGIQKLAEVNENHLIIRRSPGKTIGEMRAYALSSMEPCSLIFMNVDDDILIPRSTLFLIHMAASETFYELPINYGNWDVQNTRGYKDWDNIVYNDVSAFLADKKLGMKNIGHHLWEIPNDVRFIPTPHISPGFLLPKAYITQELVNCMMNFPKGVRGYDLELSKYVTDPKFAQKEPRWWNYIIGSNAYHMGVYESFYNESYFSKSKKAKEIDDE